MHRLIIGAKAGELVDHINGEGLDNRRNNLRIANRQGNIANSIKQDGRSSRFKGVCLNKRNSNWYAHIKVNGIQRFLGSFPTQEAAATAYNMAALRHFRDFARLNFI